ncbi:Phosphotransferase enzyme family protein [Jatrophihabitans endophyticus]|uniref:Phosphotransferase enzyme family protein n=1 Tax=Jatrophihabitans endophyticus TaxID=1206085 RepID=A0A1M5HFJ8_9ACTN|nr:phosphotransferase [Jatrophihabitans endophyticus]SHG14648.1 Phosphotransferase enzyme family protein [Jatrophihabitans endophyticus]
MPADELLAGGTANRGRVFRVGDTVHRPRGGHAPAVHALLGHLRDTGFRGAPGVVDGAADGGRVEVLDYVPGTAAVEPLPGWALTDDALATVGSLLRSFHDHAASFDATPLRWQRAVPPPWRGTLVTHNDVNPANVVFRDGRAVALIDFDLAAPGSRPWDLAIAACCWAPLREPADVTDDRAGAAARRLRALLDGYGADAILRTATVAASATANAWIAAVIRDASQAGHPAFGRMWEAQAEMYRRAGGWIVAHRRELHAAVR